MERKRKIIKTERESERVRKEQRERNRKIMEKEWRKKEREHGREI